MGKKKIIIAVIALLAVFLLVYTKYSGSAGKPADNNNGPPVSKSVAVKTAVAVQGSINPALTLSGSVAGEKEMVLTAKAQGIITSLGAKTGRRVAAGQVVAVLERKSQQLALEKSREQVNAARSALEKAKTDFAKISELYKQGAVSQADYDNAELALKNAQTAYNVAVADSQLASQSLKDTAVVAPFSGSVVECYVEEGEMVFPGSQLMTVVDDSNLKIKANLTADQLKLVAVGQKGIFLTGAHPGKEFPCTVNSISSKANPANLTYPVELILAGENGGDLKSGMFGHVKLETAGIPATVIPREALITRDESGEAEVFIVNDGRANKTKIMTGLSDDRNIAVLSGLKPGDKVVTFGQNLLKEGSLVTEGE
ncbi:MAG: efflux RND transporter periplasmic adaptor subunit [Peptococcaceae bacterium]|nr:efflux RND transporter periplasmic adaptor subunit [Peptococcaceae bacterium]